MERELRELDDELKFHLERETQKLVQAGVPAAEARRRAAGCLGERVRAAGGRACRDRTVRLAAWLPARRVTRLDPMSVLREG